jgi:Icc-related predicted phosphoesterase
MRVLLLGDTHGDATFIANVHKYAREYEVETVIQLGDFGYDFGKNTIHTIQAWLERDDSHKWYWLDGNHDHHDFIEEVIQADQDLSAPINMGGMGFGGDKVVFPDRMFYMPRGSVQQFGARTALALGGAFSIDKHARTPHKSWWHQELIRRSDEERAIGNAYKNEPIDVMLCHDAPPSEWLETQLDSNGYKVGPESKANRRTLARVVDEVRPQSLYHGHYHYRYDASYYSRQGWEVRIHGVGANVEGNWIDHTAKPGINFIVKDW